MHLLIGINDNMPAYLLVQRIGYSYQNEHCNGFTLGFYGKVMTIVIFKALLFV